MARIEFYTLQLAAAARKKTSAKSGKKLALAKPAPAKKSRKVSKATKDKIAEAVKKTHKTGVKTDGKKADYAKAKPAAKKAARKNVKSTVVYNLSDNSEQTYTLSPRQAIIAAYAQSLKDFAHDKYEERYGHLIAKGKLGSLNLGDFATAPTRKARVVVQDFGDKIGGARKDKAARSKKAGEGSAGDGSTLPAWQKRFALHPMDVYKGNGEYGQEWYVLDKRRRSKYRGIAGYMAVGRYDTEQEAKDAIPHLAAKLAFEARETGDPYTNADGSRLDDPRTGREVPEIGVFRVKTGRAPAERVESAGSFKSRADADKYIKDNAVELLNAPPVKQDPASKFMIWPVPLKDEKGVPLKDEKGFAKYEWYLARRVKAGYVKIIEDFKFASKDEAAKYLKDNAAKLVKEYRDSYGEEILVIPEKAVRTGPSWRKKDVEPEQFLTKFGMRGVEFGNWQGKRQTVLNHAYDGLMDMANALGVTPESLSFSGKMALAFGARGKGGRRAARAHYEPNYAVMNLTKVGGAGSLAHEWTHGFDHFLAQLDDKNLGRWLATDDKLKTLPTPPGTYYASTRVHRGHYAAPELPASVRDALKDLMSSMHEKTKTEQVDPKATTEAREKQRAVLASRLAGLRKTLAEPGPAGPRRKKLTQASDAQLRQFDMLAKALTEGADLGTRYTVTAFGQGRNPTGRWTNATLEGIAAVVKEVRGHDGFGDKRKPGLLSWVRQDLDGLAHLTKLAEAHASDPTATKRTYSEYYRNAATLDSRRSKPYWTEPTEMFARAFSSYIEDKLAANKQKSDYLSYGSDNTKYAKHGIKPFPEGEERSVFNEKLDKLFQALKDTGVMKAAPVKAFSPPADAKAKPKKPAAKKKAAAPKKAAAKGRSAPKKAPAKKATRKAK